jgi:hypothetical protein
MRAVVLCAVIACVSAERVLLSRESGCFRVKTKEQCCKVLRVATRRIALTH